MELGLSPGDFVSDGDPLDPVTFPQNGAEVGALPFIANFVALEQQRILVKTSSESV